ncbi:MAG: hypothetical protein ACK4P3_09060 [Fimbriimonadaceae bacterium]
MMFIAALVLAAVSPVWALSITASVEKGEATSTERFVYWFSDERNRGLLAQQGQGLFLLGGKLHAAQASPARVAPFPISDAAFANRRFNEAQNSLGAAVSFGDRAEFDVFVEKFQEQQEVLADVEKLDRGGVMIRRTEGDALVTERYEPLDYDPSAVWREAAKKPVNLVFSPLPAGMFRDDATQKLFDSAREAFQSPSTIGIEISEEGSEPVLVLSAPGKITQISGETAIKIVDSHLKIRRDGQIFEGPVSNASFSEWMSAIGTPFEPLLGNRFLQAQNPLDAMLTPDTVVSAVGVTREGERELTLLSLRRVGTSVTLWVDSRSGRVLRVSTIVLGPDGAAILNETRNLRWLSVEEIQKATSGWDSDEPQPLQRLIDQN